MKGLYQYKVDVMNCNGSECIPYALHVRTNEEAIVRVIDQYDPLPATEILQFWTADIGKPVEIIGGNNKCVPKNLLIGEISLDRDAPTDRCMTENNRGTEVTLFVLVDKQGLCYVGVKCKPLDGEHNESENRNTFSLNSSDDDDNDKPPSTAIRANALMLMMTADDQRGYVPQQVDGMNFYRNMTINIAQIVIPGNANVNNCGAEYTGATVTEIESPEDLPGTSSENSFGYRSSEEEIYTVTYLRRDGTTSMFKPGGIDSDWDFSCELTQRIEWPTSAGRQRSSVVLKTGAEGRRVVLKEGGSPTTENPTTANDEGRRVFVAEESGWIATGRTWLKRSIAIICYSLPALMVGFWMAYVPAA